MNKYIDVEKLLALIDVKLEDLGMSGSVWVGRSVLQELKNDIASLQQEQPETDIKSPFTGGKVAILSKQEEVTFREEKVKILRKYYRCEDTGREFTNDKLDDDMMWAVFRAYCEKKGMTSFTDIMLKQEQPESGCSEKPNDHQPEVDLEKEMDKYYGMYRDNNGKTYNKEIVL